MSEILTDMGKNRLRELSKLSQKKYRQSEGQVVVEGLRTLRQLVDYGIQPLEQYFTEGSQPLWESVPAWQLRPWELAKICDSEHPQGVVALFELPRERKLEFRRAFYLSGISDPGNLGTIFRIAAAFALDALLLSPDCVDVASPKVIRASLGSVFKVPFQVAEASSLRNLAAALVLTDAASGEDLRDFHPKAAQKVLIVLGSEARGIDSEIKTMTDKTLRIEMGEGIESLNVAVAAGIIAHHLFGQ